MTNDELADALRDNVEELHGKIDASSHPKKARLQRLAKAAHVALEEIARLTGTDEGSGDIQSRVGDDKD